MYLPDSLDHLLPLKERSTEILHETVQEVFQIIFDRAADLPQVFPTLRDNIVNKKTELQEQYTRLQAEDTEQNEKWTSRQEEHEARSEEKAARTAAKREE